MYHHHDFVYPIKKFKLIIDRFSSIDLFFRSIDWRLTKCAPCSMRVCARPGGHGRANAAKCSAVFPESSLTFGSEPTVSNALTNVRTNETKIKDG